MSGEQGNAAESTNDDREKRLRLALNRYCRSADSGSPDLKKQSDDLCQLVFSMYRRFVFYKIGRYSRSLQDSEVEDIFAEVMDRIWYQIRFHPEYICKTFKDPKWRLNQIATMAAQIIGDYHEKHGKLHELDAAAIVELKAAMDSEPSEAAKREDNVRRLELIEDALRRFDIRGLVRMRYFEGLSPHEMAVRWGHAYKVTTAQLHRDLKRIQEYLEKSEADAPVD